MAAEVEAVAVEEVAAVAEAVEEEAASFRSSCPSEMRRSRRGVRRSSWCV